MNRINKKLSKIIAGRTIKHRSQVDGRIVIEFTDGSILNIKSHDPAPDIAGKVVVTIKQQALDFEIQFGDGSLLKVKLAEETSSVMLRNKEEVLEYAD